MLDAAADACDAAPAASTTKPICEHSAATTEAGDLEDARSATSKGSRKQRKAANKYKMYVAAHAEQQNFEAFVKRIDALGAENRQTLKTI